MLITTLLNIKKAFDMMIHTLPQLTQADLELALKNESLFVGTILGTPEFSLSIR